jgi:molybdate transport system regulatory protein
MTNSKKKEIPKLRLRMKLNIGEGTIGPGKAKLLDAVDQYESISAAARDMGINYRRAWFLLKTMNTALGQPVALTTKG